MVIALIKAKNLTFKIDFHWYSCKGIAGSKKSDTDDIGTIFGIRISKFFYKSQTLLLVSSICLKMHKL